MLKKTVKYTDYNGEEQEDVLYFNLSKVELVELEASVDGGLSEMLKRIVESKSVPQIFQQIKKFVLLSYGERTEDGRFVKNDKILEKFTSSEAYSELFIDLLSDENKAAEFFTGIVPASVVDEVAKMISENSEKNGEEEKKSEEPESQPSEN